MADFELDAFSRKPNVTVKQAIAANTLVKRNEGWLPESIYGGSFARYGDGVLRAARNIRRLAAASEFGFHASLIYEAVDGDKASIPSGIATIIKNQVVIDVKGARHYRGTDVDFWLDYEKQNDPETLRTAAAAVVARAVELSGPEEEIFGTVVVHPSGHPMQHQPTGLAEVLSDHSEITTLRPPAGMDDPYGISKAGHLVTVYSNFTPPASW